MVCYLCCVLAFAIVVNIPISATVVDKLDEVQKEYVRSESSKLGRQEGGTVAAEVGSEGAVEAVSLPGSSAASTTMSQSSVTTRVALQAKDFAKYMASKAATPGFAAELKTKYGKPFFEDLTRAIPGLQSVLDQKRATHPLEESFGGIKANAAGPIEMREYVAAVDALRAKAVDEGNISAILHTAGVLFSDSKAKEHMQQATLAQAQGEESGDQRTLEMVSLSGYSDALCNDGTPAAYYISPAEGGSEESLKWHVHFEGGNWCFDKASCETRVEDAMFADLTSSKSYEPTLKKGGIFQKSAANPMSGWNHVHLAYCTSDSYLGNGDAFGWKFRGQRVVQAMFTDLVEKHGLGGAGGHSLLLSGFSAGGHGAMVTLDFVPGIIQAAGALYDVAVKGFLDAPLQLLDVSRGTSNWRPETFLEQAKAAYHNLNISARFPAGCAAEFQEEPWRCIMSEQVAPRMNLPHLLVSYDYDWWYPYEQLACGVIPFSEFQMKYVDEVKNAQRKILSSTPPSGSTWVSLATYEHCRAALDDWFTLKVKLGESEQAISLRGLLWKWLDASLGRDRITDSCEGFNCGAKYSDLKHALFSLVQKYLGSVADALPCKKANK